MKNGNITWGQIRNIVFVGGGIVASIVAFMNLSSRVDLLNQKVDFQTLVMEKLVSRIDKYEDELKEYNLAINEMKIEVGIK